MNAHRCGCVPTRQRFTPDQRDRILPTRYDERVQKIGTEFRSIYTSIYENRELGVPIFVHIYIPCPTISVERCGENNPGIKSIVWTIWNNDPLTIMLVTWVKHWSDERHPRADLNGIGSYGPNSIQSSLREIYRCISAFLLGTKQRPLTHVPISSQTNSWLLLPSVSHRLPHTLERELMNRTWC
jgi:hypothetical protein